MGRLIDADICLIEAWQNFYKQEDEHEKNIDGYDIMRDQFYEQSGFECCQQTIVNAPTVEAIPKADYENRLKADLKAILVELQLEIEEMVNPFSTRISGCSQDGWKHGVKNCDFVIQQKINSLKENKQ